MRQLICCLNTPLPRNPLVLHPDPRTPDLPCSAPQGAPAQRRRGGRALRGADGWSGGGTWRGAPGGCCGGRAAQVRGAVVVTVRGILFQRATAAAPAPLPACLLIQDPVGCLPPASPPPPRQQASRRVMLLQEDLEGAKLASAAAAAAGVGVGAAAAGGADAAARARLEREVAERQRAAEERAAQLEAMGRWVGCGCSREQGRVQRLQPEATRCGHPVAHDLPPSLPSHPLSSPLCRELGAVRASLDEAQAAREAAEAALAEARRSAASAAAQAAEVEAALAAKEAQLSAAQEAQRSSLALMSARGRGSTMGEEEGEARSLREELAAEQGARAAEVAGLTSQVGRVVWIGCQWDGHEWRCNWTGCLLACLPACLPACCACHGLCNSTVTAPCPPHVCSLHLLSNTPPPHAAGGGSVPGCLQRRRDGGAGAGAGGGAGRCAGGGGQAGRGAGRGVAPALRWAQGCSKMKGRSGKKQPALRATMPCCHSTLPPSFATLPHRPRRRAARPHRAPREGVGDPAQQGRGQRVVQGGARPVGGWGGRGREGEGRQRCSLLVEG